MNGGETAETAEPVDVACPVRLVSPTQVAHPEGLSLSTRTRAEREEQAERTRFSWRCVPRRKNAHSGNARELPRDESDTTATCAYPETKTPWERSSVNASTNTLSDAEASENTRICAFSLPPGIE